MKKIVDADRVARGFQKAPEIMERVIGEHLFRAALELSRDAQQRASKAFSDLTRSIRPDPDGRLAYRIGPHVQHGVFVEKGRAPGGRMPPTAAIFDWLKVKGISPLDSRYDLKDLAFAIAKKMQQRGTPAKPFMAPAASFMGDRIEQFILLGVDKALAEVGV